MKSNDIVFLYVNSINGVITGAEYQIDSAYVRSYLKRNGINTLQYIDNDIGSYIEIVDGIVSLQPSRIVVYINEYNYYISSMIIHAIKKQIMTKVIAFGPIFDDDVDIKYIPSATDYLAVGPPWQTILDIITDENEFASIPNLFYKQNNSFKFTHVDMTALKELSLDDIGLPYSEGCIPVSEVQKVGMITSIGCIGRCLFCSYNNWGYNVFFHSIEKVIAELKYIHAYWSGPEIVIPFWDDCFSVDSNHTIRLCEHIIATKIKLSFWCCTRADLLNEEILSLLSKAGFSEIVIGLETASPQVMKGLGKIVDDTSPEEYIDHTAKMYDYAVKQGINAWISVNRGLPNESFDSVMETEKYLQNKKIRNVSNNFMTIFPVSRIMKSQDNELVDVRNSPTTLPLRTYYNNYDMMQFKQYSMSPRNYYSANFIKSAICGESCGRTGASIRNIFVEDINDSTIEFIAKNIFINGAIVRNVETLTLNSKSLFSDDRKTLKYTIKEYDECLQYAYEKKYYIPNQYFIIPMKNSYYILQNNSLKSNRENLSIRKVTNHDSLNLLMEEVKEYAISKTIKTKNVIKGVIENSCMFCNTCGIKEVNRVNCCKDGDIVLCNGNNSNIKYASFDQLLRFINMRMLEIEPKCLNCHANILCSKCAFLPSWLTRDTYCSIMKEYQQEIDSYIKIINAIYVFLYENELIDEYKKSHSSTQGIDFAQRKVDICINGLHYSISF